MNGEDGGIRDRIKNLEKWQSISELKIESNTSKIEGMEKESKEYYKEIRKDYKESRKANERLEDMMSEQRKQNNEILNTILKGNQEAEKREHEYKVIKWGDIMKIIVGSLATGGVGYIVIEQILGKF